MDHPSIVYQTIGNNPLVYTRLTRQYEYLMFYCFKSQVNSYGHGVTVSSPNRTFFLASLNKQLTTTFLHILATDNNPS